MIDFAELAQRAEEAEDGTPPLNDDEADEKEHSDKDEKVLAMQPETERKSEPGIDLPEWPGHTDHPDAPVQPPNTRLRDGHPFFHGADDPMKRMQAHMDEHGHLCAMQWTHLYTFENVKYDSDFADWKSFGELQGKPKPKRSETKVAHEYACWPTRDDYINFIKYVWTGTRCFFEHIRVHNLARFYFDIDNTAFRKGVGKREALDLVAAFIAHVEGQLRRVGVDPGPHVLENGSRANPPEGYKHSFHVKFPRVVFDNNHTTMLNFINAFIVPGAPVKVDLAPYGCNQNLRGLGDWKSTDATKTPFTLLSACSVPATFIVPTVEELENARVLTFEDLEAAIDKFGVERGTWHKRPEQKHQARAATRSAAVAAASGSADDVRVSERVTKLLRGYGDTVSTAVKIKRDRLPSLLVTCKQSGPRECKFDTEPHNQAPYCVVREGKVYMFCRSADCANHKSKNSGGTCIGDLEPSEAELLVGLASMDDLPDFASATELKAPEPPTPRINEAKAAPARRPRAPSIPSESAAPAPKRQRVAESKPGPVVDYCYCALPWFRIDGEQNFDEKCKWCKQLEPALEADYYQFNAEPAAAASDADEESGSQRLRVAEGKRTPCKSEGTPYYCDAELSCEWCKEREELICQLGDDPSDPEPNEDGTTCTYDGKCRCVCADCRWERRRDARGEKRLKQQLLSEEKGSELDEGIDIRDDAEPMEAPPALKRALSVLDGELKEDLTPHRGDSNVDIARKQQKAIKKAFRSGLDESLEFDVRRHRGTDSDPRVGAQLSLDDVKGRDAWTSKHTPRFNREDLFEWKDAVFRHMGAHLNTPGLSDTDATPGRPFPFLSINGQVPDKKYDGVKTKWDEIDYDLKRACAKYGHADKEKLMLKHLVNGQVQLQQTTIGAVGVDQLHFKIWVVKGNTVVLQEKSLKDYWKMRTRQLASIHFRAKTMNPKREPVLDGHDPEPTIPPIGDDELNTYTGFKAQLLPRDQIDMRFVQPTLDHINIVFARGVLPVFVFLLAWLHRIFKYPWAKTKVALFLFSQEKRSGFKNEFWDMLRDFVLGPSLCGEGTGLKAIGGQWTHLMLDKLMFLGDELRKKLHDMEDIVESVKRVITNSTRQHTQKFVDEATVDNTIAGAILHANHKDCLVIPGSDNDPFDGRIAYLDLDPRYKGDLRYYNKMRAIWRSQRAADHFYSYIYYLDEFKDPSTGRVFNIDKYDIVNNIPDTPLSREIKGMTYQPSTRFLMHEKSNTKRSAVPLRIKAEHHWERFKTWCVGEGIKDPGTQTAFGINVKKFIPHKENTKWRDENKVKLSGNCHELNYSKVPGHWAPDDDGKVLEMDQNAFDFQAPPSPFEDIARKAAADPQEFAKFLFKSKEYEGVRKAMQEQEGKRKARGGAGSGVGV